MAPHSYCALKSFQSEPSVKNMRLLDPPLMLRLAVAGTGGIYIMPFVLALQILFLLVLLLV